jgi:hypothetical protein
MEMADKLFGLDKVKNPALRAPPPPEPAKATPAGPTDEEKQKRAEAIRGALKDTGTILGNAWKNRKGEKP